MMEFCVTCQIARLRGAIGIFYPITVIITAVDAGMAVETFRYRYECNATPTVKG